MSDTDRIERETLINAPVARVWEVLTHPTSWLGEGDAAGFDLREGVTYVFEMGDVRMHQLAETIRPHSYLSYRWAPYTAFKGAPPIPGNSTLVEFFLSETANGTLLRVVESGFDGLETSEEQRRRAADDNAGGWEGALADLKQRAEAAVS